MAHGLADLVPRHKGQNYKTNSDNSFAISKFTFEEQDHSQAVRAGKGPE
jgi:hypothetical protein